MSVHALIFTEVMAQANNYSRALGPYRIATEIRNAGYTCQVVDFFTEFSDEEMDVIIKSCISSETLIVGFSSTFFEYIDRDLDEPQQKLLGGETSNPGRVYTYNYPYSEKRIRSWFDKMLAINPKLSFVLGGSKTRYTSGFCNAFAIGYCDQAIVEYMKYLQGKNPFFQFERLNDKQIAFYGDRYTNKFEYTDSIVDWHTTDHILPGEVLPIEIARGCIFKCKFCSYPLNGKKKLDFVKKDSVIRDEFLKNYYEHGVTRYMYVDDTHNDSIEKLERLHKVVTGLPFEIEYAAYLRHDLIHAHKETASLLQESGLRSAIFGIETLNHEAGKSIGKGLHPEKIKDLLYWLRDDVWKNNVAMISGFIVGLPHDTPDTVREWAKWLFEPNNPLDYFNIEPLYIKSFDGIGRIWKSEFEQSSADYGYKIDNNGLWVNDYFNFNTAYNLAKEIKDQAIKTDRFRTGGFQLVMMANLGFIPKDIIGLSKNSINVQVAIRREKFVQLYKEKLLNRLL